MIVKLDLDGGCNLPRGVKILDVEVSHSGGCHVLVEVDLEINLPCIEVLVAAALGSDLQRAILDFIRCINGMPYDRLFDVYCINKKCRKN